MRVYMLTRITMQHSVKGGMEKHSKVLSEGLVQRGHPVTVITTKHPEGKKREVINGVEYLYLENTVAEKYSVSWWRESAQKFEELCETAAFDIVWSESWGARSCVGKLTRRYRVPSVLRLHGTAVQGMHSAINSAHSIKDWPGTLKWILGRQLLRYILVDFPVIHRVDGVISGSDKLAEDAQRHYRIPRHKIAIAHNGVDVEQFKPDQRSGNLIAQKYDIDSSEKVILLAGRVVKEKGMHLAIKMCKELGKAIPNYKLLIAGQGSYLVALRKLVIELGVNDHVIFCDHVPAKEMPAYYNACDVFLLPTLHVEVIPFALLEAMSCEKPVVSSDIGGVSSAVNDGRNGFLFPVGDIQAMLKSIVKLLSNDELATRLGRSARDTVVEQFSGDTMIDKTIEVFKNVQRSYAC